MDVIKGLPGYDWATKNKWVLQGYIDLPVGGIEAIYYKDGIFLDVYSDSRASLRAHVGLVTCTVGKFAFPPDNFDLLYDDLRGVVQRATAS